jgi:hypothetical protein
MGDYTCSCPSSQWLSSFGALGGQSACRHEADIDEERHRGQRGSAIWTSPCLPRSGITCVSATPSPWGELAAEGAICGTGQPVRRELECIRHGTLGLMGAYDLRRRKLFGFVS